MLGGTYRLLAYVATNKNSVDLRNKINLDLLVHVRENRSMRCFFNTVIEGFIVVSDEYLTKYYHTDYGRTGIRALPNFFLQGLVFAGH
jgi:hypothetical protein